MAESKTPSKDLKGKEVVSVVREYAMVQFKKAGLEIDDLNVQALNEEIRKSLSKVIEKFGKRLNEVEED